MSAVNLPFITVQGDALVVTWDHVEILVPESYYTDPPLAEDMGGRLEALAFVDLRAYEGPDSKPQLYGLRLPAQVCFQYTGTSTETDEDGDKLHVYTVNKGDLLIENLNVVQSSDNVIKLFRVLAGARITGVSYVDLANLFIDGAQLNGTNTGVSRSILEAMVSELARWEKDINVPLRIPLAAGRATVADFHLAKLKDLPRLNSVFAGIGFEDIQLAVQSGVRKTRANEDQRISPMEALIKL